MSSATTTTTATSTSTKPADTVGAGAISLQIVAPNGGHLGGGASAGGPLGEWAKKLTSLGCVATCSLVLIGAAAAIAVGALIYVYDHNAELECVGHFSSINFSYVTWLRWMGFTFLGGLVLELVFIGIHGHVATVCSSKLAVTFGFLLYFFQLAWAVVGAILYWTTVVDNCPNGSTIQAFALSIFIIESAVAVCLFLGREAVYAAA